MALRQLSTRIAKTQRMAFVRNASVVYTHTDEAPALATYALLPVLQKFGKSCGIDFVTSDISVAARILCHFGHGTDELAALGELSVKPDANIIKLPNVSASIPQLEEAIAELQAQGYDIPNYPAEPANDAERAIQATYANVLGSAVNPVLREGNSDRRAAAPVKAHAQQSRSALKPWPKESKTHIAHMSDGDFFSSEQSAVCTSVDDVKIEHVAADGTVTTLKESTSLVEGEVIDASTMSAGALRSYLAAEIADAKEKDIMLSLHLKATMMKISDPILFGHAVSVFFDTVFEKHGDALAAAGANPNLGWGAVLDKIATMPNRAEIEADIEACYAKGPRLAMVDSSKGITNLHVPSDVIIDASMPNVIRDSGKMWNKDDALEDTKALIPDRSYAPMYQQVIQYCQENGQFDASTMGHVSNVGLMAKKAEEYGSHDKTFQIAAGGAVKVTSSSGATIFEHPVAAGDLWRMCQTKDVAIKDWVKLAVSRAKATGAPAVFWLDEARAHDRSLIAKVDTYLKEHDTAGLDISIKKPTDAIQFSMERATAGKDTISVTGNVLRDYLTDLFPIIELGTSAKMLSVVPLLAGGGLYETGAGGSAPKHVQQFVEENHLRWDSLGEYLAVAVSLEELGNKTENARATLLGQTLTEATGKLLSNGKSPSRKVNELDNRGSSFYLALYWAEAMAAHDAEFSGLHADLLANEGAIVEELISCQGVPVDIGGYYKPDPVKTAAAMRPSATLNAIIDG